MAPKAKRAKKSTEGHVPQAVQEDASLAELLAPKRSAEGAKALSRRAAEKAERALSAVGPGGVRRRSAAPARLEEVMVGYQQGAEEFTPIRLVARGKELVQGEVFETQSDEIRKEYPQSPIAKALRAKYNWVAETDGGRFTRDPNKMLPAVRKDVAGKWTCDVCGKHCSEQLFVFRAFLRKEHLDPRAERCLDPFVAYISERCGRGLLGQLSEYARFKEEVFGLTTGSTDLDTARAQLEESLRRCSREDRQFLIDELERLAGVGPAGAPKTVEMEAVERLVVGPNPAALLRTAEDAFRALARTLAPRVGARLLACAALQRGLAERATGYLQSVASSLAAGGPLPQAPSPWPLKQAAACIEAVLRAANEGGEAPQLRVELACSWDAKIKAFGPGKADLTIRLGYLQARQALHAFVPSSRLGKEQAALLQQRLERLAGPMQPALNGAEAPSLPGISLRPVVRQMGRAESLGFGWHSADWAEKLKELLGVEVDFTRRPLRLATGCSGAEAPHFALQQLVGEGGFEQLWGSEINENPRRFILKNCACRHLFEDVCYIMEGGGRCARHGGHCSVPSGEVDIFVGGFPCTPYSFCNPKRFKRNCFTEPAAVPFFEMRKFIAERRPRLVVLENVRGLLAPNPETDHPPIDFILRGKNPENPEDCYQGTAPNADWGLSLIEGYGLRWDVLYSYDWGLPQSRPRVYIVMVRDDAGGQAAAERIFEVLTACSGRLPRGSCNDFMFPEGHPRLESVLQQWSEKPAQKATGRRACTKFTEALFRTKRQELGLDAQDRAYSSQRESGWFPHGTEKMVQQLDIIHAIGERQGLDFNFLLADLSQQVSRGAWRDDGNIPTLTTGCHFYSFSRHRLLLGEECLRLNGFPIEQLNLDAHTENERVFLAGNAMSVPVVGAVLFAALVSLDWGEGRTVKARQELPEPVVGPRVDLRKLAADKPAVVMAKLGPVLADDDQEVTEVPADEASKDGGLARRAAVLLALTRELSVEPKREKEKSEKESKEVESKGLVAVMQAASAPDVEEESGAGDGTGWGLRHARLLARLRKEEPLPSSQLQKWLREAVSLLLTMDRVERNESANELQQFVINALQVFRDVDSSELLGLGLEDTVAQICTQLRIAEGKAIFGRLTVQKLQAEVEQGLPPERVQAWVSQAAQLTGPELSSARAQLLVQLARSRRILARALAPLLRAWQRESAEDQELQHVQRGVEVLRKAWSTGEPPEAWVSLKEVYSLSICCTDIAKRCESRKRPKSSQVFRETAQKLQEVFPCRVVLVLRQQLDFAQMMREARTLPQDWVSVQVAWQMCEHLANIMQVDESQLETWQLAQEKLPSLHGLGYELARLRHLGREEAPAADEFLRRLAPAIAVQVHAIERQCGGGEGAAQCRASMGHFCDWAVRRLPELYQVALLAWCSERVAHFSGHLEERLSEWSQHLNGVLKGVQKVLQMEFENQEDLALPPEKQNAMKGHHTEAVKAQVRLQHHVARLTLVENYLSRAGRASALQHAMVRQWLVELLDFSAEGLENQVLASHATYKALDQVLQVPDLKPIVEALKEAPVVIQGWRVSQSRAGLTFYQTSDGRLTRWTLPVAVVDVRTENVVWTPPKTPPQDDGLMTPPAEKGVAELELQEAAAQTAPLMIVPATPALTLRVPATPMVPMATPTTPARCPPPSLAQTAPAPMVAAARPAAHLPPTPPLPPPPPPPAPPAPPARPALPALPTSAPAEARWSRPPETPQMLAPASPDEGVQRPNEPQKPPKRKAAHLQTSPVDPKKSKPAEPEWPDKPRPAEWPDWAERERRSTPVAPTPVQLPDSTVPVVAEFLQQRIPKAFWRNSAQPKAPNPTPQPPKMPPPEHLLQGRLGKP